MENYRIFERLGKGAQGSVHLAEHRKSGGSRIVLKKIECNDESDANKAFKEALALKKLQHAFVCGFKELFVEWDKELSAMFVCLVMDYYTKGDLSSIIRHMRDRSEPIDELVIKKWLGQILQALLFIHNNGVIHRDLKPSNIFIQDDDSVAIGDFGVATVMADVLTRTRSTVGTLNYMAPEVLEQPHDERTDVWSLGCIALELATCQYTDPSEMAGLLSKIKHDHEALTDVLEKVRVTYSSDLVAVIQNMLETSHTQRPTPSELAENPYIKECLDLSGNILLEKQKRQRSGRTSARPVPNDKGMAAMMEYLTDNLGDENSLRKGLEHLVDMTRDDGSAVNDDGKRIIVKVMSDYMTEEDIQISATQTLVNLVMTATTNDVLFTADVISVVLKAMETHPKSGALQQTAANLIMALSADEKATELIGEMRGVHHVLGALRGFVQDTSICTACLNAMWSLAVNEDNVRILTENQAIFAVVEAMKTHSNSPELLEAASAVILSLSMEDENIVHINTLNCVGLIIDAIQEHMIEPKLVKNACMALAAIVEPDEESAFRVLSNNISGREVSGIPIIMKAYHIHKDNAEVVENICTLAMELLEYDEILAEMKHLRLREDILIPIHRRFKENMDIMRPCENALAKLGMKNPPLHQS